VGSLTSFAFDHKDRYPPSVATIGSRGYYWSWLEPITMITYPEQYPMHYRSMSAYLSPYVENADTLACPNAPEIPEY